MKKIVVVLLVVAAIIFSCNGGDKKENKDSAAACKTNSLNPNGDSELAILMREFAAYTDSVKQDLLNNRTPRPKPANLSQILTAKKTDESIDKSVFTPLAQSYIASVEYFYNAAPEEKTDMYNSMVNMCINCHKNFCGGPIKRIQKLFIPMNQ
jgi:hypothetical protein